MNQDKQRAIAEYDLQVQLNAHLSATKRARNHQQATTAEAYDNPPASSLPTYAYTSGSIYSFFSKQKEFGKPVKVGKHYRNAFFTDLASIHHFHTYVAGWLSLGTIGGVGRELNSAEKKSYKAHRDENGLFQMHGEDKTYIDDGIYPYVVSPKGGLYIVNSDERMFHNSVRASQPVQCAGEVLVIDGEIQSITNGSGHYRPTYQQLLRTVGGLYATNLINAETQVYNHTANGMFAGKSKFMGTIQDLIDEKQIQLPNGWEATEELHNKMTR